MLRCSALFLVILAGCPQQQKTSQDPAVVATVNGEVIKRVEFERLLSREARCRRPSTRWSSSSA